MRCILIFYSSSVISFRTHHHPLLLPLMREKFLRRPHMPDQVRTSVCVCVCACEHACERVNFCEWGFWLVIRKQSISGFVMCCLLYSFNNCTFRFNLHICSKQTSSIVHSISICNITILHVLTHKHWCTATIKYRYYIIQVSSTLAREEL